MEQNQVQGRRRWPLSSRPLPHNPCLRLLDPYYVPPKA
jgi:hypothetical protein